MPSIPASLRPASARLAPDPALALLLGVLTMTPASAVLGQGMFPAAPNPFSPEYQARLEAPLGKLTAVTEEMLRNPPPDEWLLWRRTYDGWGFSPLQQITASNVGNLQLAWSWSMTNGASETTPIVHDGVLFIQNYGDSVDALNAESGDLLWRYERPAPQGANRGFKKMMAIYGDRLFLATSDHGLVALDMKSGKVAWEHPVSGEGMFTSGPMIADGVLMIGTTACVTSRCFISGYDPATGNELWRFYTVAASGEPGGKTWNGLPDDARFGGSSWTSGSYDPRTRIAYWGVGQPYPWSGAARGTNVRKRGWTNELLYTDNTLALEPKTGKLIWHHSHLPNDNWDMDYVFERHLIDLKINGTSRQIVVTTGKLGIIEGIDAQSGKFVFAHDLGLQNIVSRIDPLTGDKTINPAVVPTADNTVMMCPHPGGARNFGATTLDPRTKILYLPMQENCADMTSVPREPGEKTNFPHYVLRLRPGSDGQLGRLQAFNLETGKPVWAHRERAPMSSGALATAGGLIFQGTFDRYFKAFDSATGAELWQTRLNDMATSYPITFSVKGTQYVAISSGSGNPYSNTWGSLVPEMRRPPGGGSVLWVFRLPGTAVRPSSAEVASRDMARPTPATATVTTAATATAATTVTAATTADNLAPAFYSQVQAQRGAAVYRANCASCHGDGLNDGAFARALRGEAFRREWNQKTLGALGQFILLNMPPGKAGQLTRDQYADVLAFLISANGVSAGAADLPADPAAWERLAAPR
jgi:alcohol dehydrogenase (cytochrome c)